MSYLLNDEESLNLFIQVEKDFLQSEKIKFQRLNKWRKEFVPDFPGVYSLYEKVGGGKYTLLYIGESGNLRERMTDICRTVNHTFRRQLGHRRFSGVKTSRKFEKEIETLLDIFFDESLYVSFLKVNFGRTEIESFLVTKYQTTLLNSETKRKLKIQMANL